MLVINVEVRVEAGAVESVKAAIATMERESLKEEGCETYAFSVDVNDPTMLRITERWQSMEALEAHFATPHMAEFGQAMGALQPQSMDAKLYEIARELPLPGAS